jgi:hypothetical protein
MDPNIIARLNGYASDAAAADFLIQQQQERIADLEAECGTYRELSAKLIAVCQQLSARAFRLKHLAMVQKVALDERSRVDDNYSQWYTAHRFTETMAERSLSFNQSEKQARSLSTVDSENGPRRILPPRQRRRYQPRQQRPTPTETRL